MGIIITIVIIVLIVKFLKKKSNGGDENTIQTPAPGSKAEKKAMKEFQYEYMRATGEYGNNACESMGKVAEAYAVGKGVEKDVEKAKYWKEREIRTQLQQRAYMCEFYGPRGYVADLSFFIDGKWIPADLEKAEELAWLLYRTGTIGAEDILKTVMEKKYPDKKEDLNLQAILAIDPLRCAAKRDRSREVYPEFCAEMKNEGVSGQKAKIKWLLKKAGMDVAVEEVQFPGAAAELEKQFLEARKLEAEGKDFKQVAQAYEPIAEAGHSEAMRRLGLIKRDILSENACTALYETGQKLLEKAAEAGNTLAAYDLGKKEPDIAFLAGLAGQENLDALYALGCLLENKNWEVAQACFRNIEEILGDPIAKKNGEGIEWLRKLGDKFGIMDSKYYLKLADAGTQIGYIPSQMELALMTHVMMERAFEKSGNKAGQYGDFGYAAYIINVLDGPAKAGIAKAKAMISNYRTEQSAYYTWQGKELKEAEAGTGIAWEYLKNKTTPKERLARTAANHHLQVQAVYYTRIFKGLNYYQIHKRLFDSDAGEASVEEFMKAMPATTSKNTASKSSFTYDSNAMDDYKADTSFKNMPSCIYDDNNNRWDKQYAYDTCAVYRNFDLGEETITSCSISGKYANGYGRNFHWY